MITLAYTAEKLAIFMAMIRKSEKQLIFLYKFIKIRQLAKENEYSDSSISRVKTIKISFNFIATSKAVINYTFYQCNENHPFCIAIIVMQKG